MMEASYLLLITCLLGSLSKLVEAEQQSAESQLEVGSSRAAAIKRTEPGKPVEQVAVRPGLLDNIKAGQLPNWLYVYLNDTSVKGYSVRISDKVMLSPKGLLNPKLKLVAGKDLPDTFDPKDMKRPSVIYQHRTHDIIRECSIDAWLYIERFRYNVTQSGWTSGFIMIPDPNWLARSDYDCKLYSHRKIGSNIFTMSSMRVKLACSGNGPLCEVNIGDKLQEDTNSSYQFCPEDSGAPIVCFGIYLAAMIHAEENTKCLKSVLASRVNGINEELKKILAAEGDKPYALANPKLFPSNPPRPRVENKVKNPFG